MVAYYLIPVGGLVCTIIYYMIRTHFRLKPLQKEEEIARENQNKAAALKIQLAETRRKLNDRQNGKGL